MVQLIGKLFLLEFPQGKVLMKLNQLSFSSTIVLLRELIPFHSGVLLTGGFIVHQPTHKRQLIVKLLN